MNASKMFETVISYAKTIGHYTPSLDTIKKWLSWLLGLFPSYEQALTHLKWAIRSYFVVRTARGLWWVLKKIAHLMTYVRRKLEKNLPQSFVEKMMPGSVLAPTTVVPPHQCEILVSYGSAFCKSGQGFLTEYGLVTAAHVITGSETVRIQTKSGTFDVDTASFELIDSDVVIYRNAQRLSSKLALKQGKLHKSLLSPTIGVMAQIVAMGQTSYGMLKRSDVFGMVTFEGSTTKGFSGAPYTVGDQIFGIHIGGGALNYGFSSAYLQALFAHSLESSEDWWFAEFEKGRVVNYLQSPMSPDEYFVEFKDGRIHLVDGDIINEIEQRQLKQRDRELYSRDFQVESAQLPLTPRGALQYADSKNLIKSPAAHVLAAGQLKMSQDVPQPRSTVSATTDSASQRSSKQSQADKQAEQTSLDALLTKMRESSIGQQLIPAQLKDHLQLMLTAMPKSQARSLRRQLLVSLKELAKQQRIPIDLGL